MYIYIYYVYIILIYLGIKLCDNTSYIMIRPDPEGASQQNISNELL